MEYAEAVSRTPPTVTDEMSARLLGQLGAPALVELTAFIALANLYTRTNTAFGIECGSNGTGASATMPAARLRISRCPADSRLPRSARGDR